MSDKRTFLGASTFFTGAGSAAGGSICSELCALTMVVRHGSLMCLYVHSGTITGQQQHLRLAAASTSAHEQFPLHCYQQGGLCSLLALSATNEVDQGVHIQHIRYRRTRHENNVAGAAAWAAWTAAGRSLQSMEQVWSSAACSLNKVDDAGTRSQPGAQDARLAEKTNSAAVPFKPSLAPCWHCGLAMYGYVVTTVDTQLTAADVDADPGPAAAPPAARHTSDYRTVAYVW